MNTRRTRLLGTLAALVLTGGTARADYVSQTLGLSVPTDSVRIEAYDGIGAAGGGLNAGEVRITFHRTTPPPPPPPPGTLSIAGFQALGFNTDLGLSSGQLTGPAGWSQFANTPLSTYGTFSWAFGTLFDLHNDASVLITGLGSDATTSHFQLPSQGGSTEFAANWVSLSIGSGGFHSSSEWTTHDVNDPQATPEPTSLVLGAAGLAALVAGRLARRRRQAV